MDWQLIVFCCVLIGFFLFSLSLIFGVLRYGAPPMPSSPMLRKSVLNALQAVALPPGALLDVGSGWGGLARRMARQFPERSVAGVEPLLIPYCFSVLVQKLLGPSNLSFRWGYARAQDAEGAAAVVLYLGPKATRRVAPLFLGQCLLVSAFFKLPDREANFTHVEDDPLRSSVFVYGEVSHG